MTEVNVSATVGMSTTVGEMSATVGEMFTAVGECSQQWGECLQQWGNLRNSGDIEYDLGN